MTVIRVLSRVAFLLIATVLVSFVVFNHESFGVSLPSLEFRYWAGPNDALLAPPIPLFVFCACFFVLGVLLMGLASMQVYGNVVGSWRRLRKERRAHEPERLELERSRAALAREREEYEPKRRELEFRTTELDHRADELRRDREALAEARSHLAAERAELAKSRAELGAERRDVERARLDVESARAALERDRARAIHETRELQGAPVRAASEPRFAVPSVGGESHEEPVTRDDASSAEAAWDLAERLDDDVAAVARLSEASEPQGTDAENPAPATERVTESGEDPATSR
ncbi:MAG: hypothetical protein U0610_04530 [bacterium]